MRVLGHNFCKFKTYVQFNLLMVTVATLPISCEWGVEVEREKKKIRDKQDRYERGKNG